MSFPGSSDLKLCTPIFVRALLSEAANKLSSLIPYTKGLIPK